MNYDLLREMLDRHEGNRLKRYRCTADHWTIGRGWNLDAHPLPEDIATYERLNGCITPAMSDRLFNISIDAAERQARAIFKDFGGFSERRQAALVDWIFNIGAGGALKFKKALAAIMDGDWERAADEMQDSAWFKQTKGRAVEVVGMVRNG